MATTPIDLAKKKEQLLRVTAARPATATPQPPAQKPSPLPGVTGTLPLPTGLAGLTPLERETLQAAGFEASGELPQTSAGIKDLQAAVEMMVNRPDKLPVDPKTPPLKPEIKQLNDLPESEQQRFRDVVANIRQNEAVTRTPPPGNPIPGMDQAAATVNSALSYSVEVGGKKAEAQAEQPKPQAESAAPSADPEAAGPPPSPTGAAVQKTNCGWCGHGLSDPDIPVPSRAERIAFLHSILAFQPYRQEVSVYDGKLRLTFRVLTTDELTAMYEQTAQDQQAGKLMTVDDYYEKLNHYRLALQLVKVVTVADVPVVKSYPEGLSAATNPSADTVWVGEGEKVNLADVLDYVIKDALKSETLFRIVHQACSRFNRSVTKMEAMATSSDFTNETVSAS